MKRLKKIIGSVFMAVMLCMMMTTVAFGAETDSVWLHVSETSDGKGTEALIAANTTVTDGLLELTYDSTKLTYQDVTVSEEYVAMYAVNADEAGVVLISWVAPEAYVADGEDMVLIQVNFTGIAGEDSLGLNGTTHDAEGDEAALGDVVYVDLAALKEAVTVAEGKAAPENESKYTRGSFTALKEALAEAEAVLADPLITPADVEEALANLNKAMDNLKAAYVPESEKPDNSEKPSAGENAATGDNANIVLPAVMAVIAIAVVAVLVIMKKRGQVK